MATETTAPPLASRRQLALEALAELADGGLAERLRQEEAACVLRTLRRALEMTGRPLPPLPPALAGWDSDVTTAREHVETLPPAEVDRLLAEGPRWAAALLRAVPDRRRAA